MIHGPFYIKTFFAERSQFPRPAQNVRSYLTSKYKGSVYKAFSVRAMKTYGGSKDLPPLLTSPFAGIWFSGSHPVALRKEPLVSFENESGCDPESVCVLENRLVSCPRRESNPDAFDIQLLPWSLYDLAIPACAPKIKS